MKDAASANGFPPRRLVGRFVKYTFLAVEGAWRRLEPAERQRHKREFIAACEDFAQDHLFQTFTLVGTRADADLLLVAEAENLERIHELHVVLAQTGLLQWSRISHSFLGLRKPSEYSEELRLQGRPFKGKYLFVYPFVKSRGWYALPAEERQRIMAEHIRIGKEYPTVDNHTAYSFGLDDQEFVVAFDTNDPAAFVELVQRLRTSEASQYTVRDTPSFTCLAASLVRALGALDGEALPRQAPSPA